MSNKIPRRRFGKSLLALSGGSLTSTFATKPGGWPCLHHTTLHDTEVVIPGIEKRSKILQISDSHISIRNEAEADYDRYGQRMHNAFKSVRHFESGADGLTTAHFQNLVAYGANQKVDLLALSGDILNYPSAVGVAFVQSALTAAGIPHLYTAGNHDWHYEGMEGTADELRDYWCNKALQPLYNGGIYASSKQVGDVNVVMIDNSTYQVNEEQLRFFRNEIQKGLPVALIVHIPLYYPGMRMCCGHPDWGWNADRGFETERRLRWSRSGNLPSTTAFVKEVRESDSVVGVFAGHWHRFHSAASAKGPHQHLTLPAFSGQYRMIHFVPEAEALAGTVKN